MPIWRNSTSISSSVRTAAKRSGLEDRFVMVYSGSVGGWYLTEEMADFLRL